MAWNTLTTYTAASAWGATQANGVGNDLRTYGGNVDAAGYNLSNMGILTFAAGGRIASVTSIGAGVASPAAQLELARSGAAASAEVVRLSYGADPTYYNYVKSGFDGGVNANNEISFWIGTAAKAHVNVLALKGSGRVALPTGTAYADNAAAVAAGLVAGDVYWTTTGELRRVV